MRIVVAPDSFKESMTAVQAAQAMAVGVRDALPTDILNDGSAMEIYQSQSNS